MSRPPANPATPLLIAVATLAAASFSTAPAAPPETKVVAVADTLHGVVQPDLYRWLEEQESPATRDWLQRQIAYTESFYPKFTAMKAVEARYKELERVEKKTQPKFQGGRYFYTRRMPDQELWTTWWRQGHNGEEKLLLDPNQMSKDLRTNAELTDISRDGTVIAYSIRQGGQDEEEVRFRNVDTGQDLPDVLPRNAYYGLSINRDRTGCYYSALTPERTGRIRYHRFGTPVENDPVIFGDGYGPDKILAVALSEDRGWLQITVYYGSAGTKNEFWVKNVVDDGPVMVVAKDMDAFFNGTILGNQVYLQTNLKAPKWKVMVADLSDPVPEHWREVVPEAANAIAELGFAGGRIFVTYMENVSDRVSMFGPAGEPLGPLPLPGMGSVDPVSGHWDSPEVFYSFVAFNVPKTIYRYDVSSGISEVYFRPATPFKSDDFEVEQVWVPSKDGTRIPMFLAHKKGLSLDGNNPVYLTGYGGFNVPSTPVFASSYAIWMEAGGVLAQPALRGGGEFGEDWHRAGMLGKKQNVFDDFIAAADWLVANKYTQPSRLVISGGSNGGLLVGAVMTQRPDLCRAVVCWHPLLDMLRYHRTLMGPYWISEYGSADVAEQFPYLRAYSPYQHVQKGVKYPAVLFITGDGDTRVDPMHARKMTALLQSTVEEGTPVLLYYDLKSGHVGGNPVYKNALDTGVELGFVMWQLGMSYGTMAGHH